MYLSHLTFYQLHSYPLSTDYLDLFHFMLCPTLGFLYTIFSFLFFFFILRPYPQHMEVPRLGVELELQLQAYATAKAMPDLNIWDLTTASSNARFIIHWTRPSLKPESSQILIGLLTHWATMGTFLTFYALHTDVLKDGSISSFRSWCILLINLTRASHTHIPLNYNFLDISYHSMISASFLLFFITQMNLLHL